MPPVSSDPAAPRVSIVVPVRNEAANIAPLVEEIERVCAALVPFEVIYVDDGSGDGTLAEITRLRVSRPWLRAVTHSASAGQSAALRSGVRAARGEIVATLDGDGENDPAFIPALVARIAAGQGRVGLAAGQRVGRTASPFKRVQSRLANAVRGAILKDGTRDSGCGLKAFPRDLFLALPYFAAMHRFLPALVAREGYAVAHVDVVDRQRLAGRSNYGLFDRLWVGILDMAGVWWLIRRGRRAPEAREV